MSNIVRVDDASFDTEVLDFKGFVLVEFGATWCGPCQRQHPILEQFKKEHPEIKVVSVDIDEATNASARFSIRSVPTIMLFNKGIRAGAPLVGLSTLSKIVGLLESVQ